MQEKDKDNLESALKVNDGVNQPDQINPAALERLRQSRQVNLTASDYVNGIIKGNRVILSKSITLIESTIPTHQHMAQEVIEGCLPHSGKSLRIGITGVPGVGKSTFIEALGKHVTGSGHKLAVLAIDPSSTRTKGSILGDKTRMEELSADTNAFIRPSPSAGSLGGVARKTKESIILCEAAGFDVIFVETVGVGQSETAVHSMVDFFLLLMLSGAGDELQGIKRGIMEMADAIFINKADGDNRHRANQAKLEYQNALHLFPLPASGWKPVVGTCSALSKEGIAEVWKVITDFEKQTKESGFFNRQRLEQKNHIMHAAIEDLLLNDFFSQKSVKQMLPIVESELLSDKMSAYVAAQKLFSEYLKKHNPGD